MTTIDKTTHRRDFTHQCQKKTVLCGAPHRANIIFGVNLLVADRSTPFIVGRNHKDLPIMNIPAIFGIALIVMSATVFAFTLLSI